MVTELFRFKLLSEIIKSSLSLEAEAAANVNTILSASSTSSVAVKAPTNCPAPKLDRVLKSLLVTVIVGSLFAPVIFTVRVAESCNPAVSVT